MTRHAYLTFATTFPDDTIWDGYDCVRLGGLNVTECIAGLLRAKGMEVLPPIEDGEHGWVFDIHWCEQRFWVRVIALEGEENIILTQDNSSGLVARLIGKRSFYPEFLKTLNECLDADDRFSKLRWYTDFTRGGRTQEDPLDLDDL